MRIRLKKPQKGAGKHSSSANDGRAVGKAMVTPIASKDGVDIFASTVSSGLNGLPTKISGEVYGMEKNISRTAIVLEILEVERTAEELLYTSRVQ